MAFVLADGRGMLHAALNGPLVTAMLRCVGGGGMGAGVGVVGGL